MPTRPAARPLYYPRAKKEDGREEVEEEGEEMGSSREDARARLLAHFSDGTSDTPDRWAVLWDKGDFLPWDIGAPNPALGDVLTDRKELIGTCFKEEGTAAEKEGEDGRKVRKKALVPGCGRGYDVILLASFGYDAYGLEVSDKAVELCVQEQQTNGAKYPIEDESVGYGTVNFLKGDFFRDEWTKKIPGGGKFDLIYDYTVRLFPSALCISDLLFDNNYIGTKTKGLGFADENPKIGADDFFSSYVHFPRLCARPGLNVRQSY